VVALYRSAMVPPGPAGFVSLNSRRSTSGPRFARSRREAHPSGVSAAIGACKRLAASAARRCVRCVQPRGAVAKVPRLAQIGRPAAASPWAPAGPGQFPVNAVSLSAMDLPALEAEALSQ
jgi:hypothetical protein